MFNFSKKNRLLIILLLLCNLNYQTTLFSEIILSNTFEVTKFTRTILHFKTTQNNLKMVLSDRTESIHH